MSRSEEQGEFAKRLEAIFLDSRWGYDQEKARIASWVIARLPGLFASGGVDVEAI